MLVAECDNVKLSSKNLRKEGRRKTCVCVERCCELDGRSGQCLDNNNGAPHASEQHGSINLAASWTLPCLLPCSMVRDMLHAPCINTGRVEVNVHRCELLLFRPVLALRCPGLIRSICAISIRIWLALRIATFEVLRSFSSLIQTTFNYSNRRDG